MRPVTPIVLLAVGLVASACGEPTSSARTAQTRDGLTAGVQVTDAWCRATPNGARTGACYATFLAVGGDDRLVSLESSAATRAEIHDMDPREGMMRMTPLAGGLALTADEPVALEPGATHIMLTGLTSPLRPGEQAPMVLTFESGRRLELLVPVRRGAAR